MSRPRKRSTASLLVPAWLRSWARRHAYSFLSSLGSISRQPLASFMTIAMLAITLSLPAGLYVTLDNIGRAGHGWERLDSISIFMDESQGREKAIQLASLVSTWPTVSAVDLISPEKGMAELAGRLQLDDVAGEIASNPLPWVLEVTLAAGEDVRLVATRLEDVEGVDQVIVDLQWLDRLQAIVALLRKMAALLAVLFALAVMFVIGNTVRMEINNRHQEIRVLALIGATDGFVRRPFLYSGLWYGLAGGVLAWLLTELGLLLLAGPVERLSASYAGTFALSSLPAGVVALFAGGSGLLGIIGAWLVVERHLKSIHPE
ncbi:MAG TPA: permease-like cell division protein FtsX [Wenzhouxiangella sp.]|nr:permease-like cell division protein FtsX [Wenzhouxiangella sp.]